MLENKTVKLVIWKASSVCNVASCLLCTNKQHLLSSCSVPPTVLYSCIVRCCTAGLGKYLSSLRSALQQILVPFDKRRASAPGLRWSCGRWWRVGCTAATETFCCPDPWLQRELSGSIQQHQKGPVEAGFQFRHIADHFVHQIHILLFQIQKTTHIYDPVHYLQISEYNVSQCLVQPHIIQWLLIELQRCWAEGQGLQVIVLSQFIVFQTVVQGAQTVARHSLIQTLTYVYTVHLVLAQDLMSACKPVIRFHRSKLWSLIIPAVHSCHDLL